MVSPQNTNSTNSDAERRAAARSDSETPPKQAAETPDSSASTAEQLDAALEEQTTSEELRQEMAAFEFKIADIKVRVTPRFKESWEEYLEHAQPGSVAIDGRVEEDTRESDDKLVWNINHARLIPKEVIGASCEQALRASEQGVFRNLTFALKKLNATRRQIALDAEQEPPEDLTITVDVEDADPDVLWTIAVIAYADKYRDDKAIMQRMRAGVRFEDIVDRNNGTLPLDFINAEDIDHLKAMLEVNTFVSEPYQDAREALGEMSARKIGGIITDGVQRIHNYITAADDDGQPWTGIPIPVGYKEIQDVVEDLRITPGEGWTFTTQEEQWARFRVAARGVKRVFSFKGERESGAIDVSAVSIGADANFDLPTLCVLLNRLEKEWISTHPDIAATLDELDFEGVNEWGTHGANVMGSPRQSGTFLPLELIIHVQNRYVEWKDASLDEDAEVATRDEMLSVDNVRTLIAEYEDLIREQ